MNTSSRASRTPDKRTRTCAQPRTRSGCRVRLTRAIVLLGLWACTEASADILAGPLSLEDAVQLALAHDPGVAALQARADGFAEQAVADGQLPDPQLKLGAVNFPVDTFSFSQEPMTQAVVGITQAFPPGNSLSLRRRQTEAMSAQERAGADEQGLAVRRSVRDAWLRLYYQIRASRIIEETRGLFSRLAAITQSYYASGRRGQQDVIEAQLELSRLDDRLIDVAAQTQAARADLAKWIGGAAAQRDLPGELPALPEPGAKDALRSGLDKHPFLEVQQERIEQARLGVALAREQYKPGLRFDLSYGFRGGQDPGRGERPDFFTALATIDLPLFREKRQDRHLAASQQQLNAALLTRDDRYRELLRMLEADYATWERLDQRQRLFRKTLLPQARQNAEAAMNAYRSDLADLTTLIRAQATELDTRLADLRVRVDHARAQAALLYLAGK
jgi:outer membrane protein TolC